MSVRRSAAQEAAKIIRLIADALPGSGPSVTYLRGYADGLERLRGPRSRIDTDSPGNEK